MLGKLKNVDDSLDLTDVMPVRSRVGSWHAVSFFSRLYGLRG